MPKHLRVVTKSPETRRKLKEIRTEIKDLMTNHRASLSMSELCQLELALSRVDQAIASEANRAQETKEMCCHEHSS